jgi:phosphomannomutase
MIENLQDKLLFSVAGARGIVGRGIDVNVVSRLSFAFASVLPPGPIVVGRDTRPSGTSLLSSVIGALTAAGRECINLDIATTPTVELVVEKLQAAGGIIVTASHNPVEWNALKFLDGRGIFINKINSERLHEAFASGRRDLVDAVSTGKITSYERSAEEHIEAILGLHILDVDRITRRSFRVVLDCINGAGSVIAPRLLEAMGATVVELNCATDGNFSHNPEPRAENLHELAERVRTEHADIGFALDPDADRLALVDGKGVALSEELTLALAVDQVLHTEKRGPVVVNMSTSAIVDWVAERYRATVLRTPVGEAHVVDTMLEARSPIGGEGNGGVIYPELHPGRDGLVGMALILQLLAERGVTITEQIGEYPVFHMVKEKVSLGGEFSVPAISDLLGALHPAKIDTGDGVKAIFDDGWCHVRVSNTEGIVRIIAESMSKQRTAALCESVRSLLEKSWNRPRRDKE